MQRKVIDEANSLIRMLESEYSEDHRRAEQRLRQMGRDAAPILECLLCRPVLREHRRLQIVWFIGTPSVVAGLTWVCWSVCDYVASKVLWTVALAAITIIVLLALCAWSGDVPTLGRTHSRARDAQAGQRERAALLLAGMDGAWAIGLLLEVAYMLPDGLPTDTNTAVRDALVRLLPVIDETAASALTARQRECFGHLLLGSVHAVFDLERDGLRFAYARSPFYRPLAEALIRAAIYIGGSSDLTWLESLARDDYGKWASRAQDQLEPLKRAARESIGPLRQRLEAERSGARLLRPATPIESTLLRPAGSTATAAPDEALLRASECRDDD